MTYTAQSFIQSPAFMAIATEDAIKVVAKANRQTVAATVEAFNKEVSTVVASVARLVAEAAKHCADEANAGRLWA